MRRVLAFAGLLCLVQAVPATADEVTLINGDRLTGHIVEMNAETLRLQTELLGEVSIPRSAIASLTADQDLAITLPDDRVITGTLAAQEGQAEIRDTAQEATAVAVSDLKAVRTPEGQAEYENRLHPRWYQSWQTGVNAAISARGGGGTTRLTIGIDTARYTEKDEFTASYFSLVETEKSGSVVNDDKSRLAALYLRKLQPQLYYFVGADFDRDDLQNLILRAVLASGLGLRLKEADRTVFDVFGGGAFNQEFFQDESVRRTGEVLVGEYLRWRLASRTYFEERLQFFPNLNNGGEYRLQFTSTFETRINTWLSWQLSFHTHFLSDPPPETKRNDMLLTSGIRLNFGQTGSGHRLHR